MVLEESQAELIKLSPVAICAKRHLQIAIGIATICDINSALEYSLTSNSNKTNNEKTVLAHYCIGSAHR